MQDDGTKRVLSVLLGDKLSSGSPASDGLSLIGYCLKYQDSIFVVTEIDGRIRNARLSELPAGILLRHLGQWEQSGMRPVRTIS